MSIAGLFPGQGSQSLGMLSELADSFALIQQTFAEAADILGQDFWQMSQQGSEAALNSTENTQPLMLLADISVWRVWLSQGGCRPVAVAGHSLGEYAALVAADVLSLADALSLVAQRAHLMQHAVPAGQGAMAALLGLDDEQVIAACAEAALGEVVEAVNFNAPGQVVIAGQRTAVERAITLAKAKGAKRAVLLPVSVPSHCSLMKPAAEQLSSALEDVVLQVPTMPVLQNIEGTAQANLEAMRMALAQQLYQPVRWASTIRHLQTDYQVEQLIEFGPGKVLSSLNKRIGRGLASVCISDNASLEAALKWCEGNSSA